MSDVSQNSYQKLEQQFNVLTVRERLLITVAGLVLILFVGYFLFIEPMQLDTKAARKQIAQLKQTQASLETQLEAVKRDLTLDPNAALDTNIEASRQAIRELDDTLAAQIYNLVPANAMPELLEQVLSQSSGVELLEMTSLAPTRMLGEKQDGKDDALTDETGLFQHGVRLTLRGSYFDIQRYLARTETLSWQFYWKIFAYRVVDYPQAEVQIELYTLSTSQAFIGVGVDE